MKDSLHLLKVYKKYLNVTEDLIVILERNIIKNEKINNPILKAKYNEFEKHALETMGDFHNDLHKIIALDYELKKLEEIELKGRE